MKIGYARVSTRDQNLDMQMDALNKIECDKIFTDKMSGARSPEASGRRNNLRFEIADCSLHTPAFCYKISEGSAFPS